MTDWEPLKGFENYEINNKYPYNIRNLKTNRILKIVNESYGYKVVWLNNRFYRHHRLIAQQWIPNPDNLPEIDHINHNKEDNRLCNLRWVSHGENQMNRKSYKGEEAIYEDELSEYAIEIKEYGNHEFEDLWFDDDKFYYYTGAAYRELKYHVQKGQKALYIQFKDINRIQIKIYLNKFKRLYNIE